jgi:hypothetical protein
MRAWKILKASGAAVLLYLLPEQCTSREAFQAVE